MNKINYFKKYIPSTIIVFTIIIWIFFTLNNAQWNNLDKIKQFHISQKKAFNEKELIVDDNFLEEKILEKELEKQLFLESSFNVDIKPEKIAENKMIIQDKTSIQDKKTDEKENEITKELEKFKLEEEKKLTKELIEKKLNKKKIILEEIKSKKVILENKINLELEELRKVENEKIKLFLSNLRKSEEKKILEEFNKLKKDWENKILKSISEFEKNKKSEIFKNIAILKETKEKELKEKINKLNIEKEKELNNYLKEKESEEIKKVLSEIESKKIIGEKNIISAMEKKSVSEKQKLEKKLEELRIEKEKEYSEEFKIYKKEKIEENKKVIKKIKIKKEKEQLEKINIENIYSCNDLYKEGYKKSWNYNIKIRGKKDEKLKVYCDMETSGWGWTLIFTSSSAWWNWNSIYSNNSLNPSIDKNYSILNKADSIKTIEWNKIQYRIDANEFWKNWWIWEVSDKYSFVSRSKYNTNISLIEKYWYWKYSNIGIEKRMPYICNWRFWILSTSRSCNSKWFWTIAARNYSFSPAPWLYKWVKNPGVIWYWVK